jgi:hypothetical protein
MGSNAFDTAKSRLSSVIGTAESKLVATTESKLSVLLTLQSQNLVV